ncbi:MAG: hypothetical protein JW810_01215 [Sedimentisphaerales bacterium]|nr:hypothetical protein [Sedimentisphaerales bacterium]
MTAVGGNPQGLTTPSADLPTPSVTDPASDRPADALPSRFLWPLPLRDLGKSHKVRLVYFVPADRQPAAQYRAKIQTVLTFVNDIYCRSLRDQGYVTEGLDFYFSSDGLEVLLLRGDRPAAYYSGAPDYRFVRTWQTVLPEVERHYGSAAENLYVIFVESYDPGPAPYEWPGGVALGARYGPGGGAGMFSAWILRDEFCAPTIEGQLAFLADDTPIAGRTALGGGGPDSPRYEFIEDGFGAVLHEMGHAFGLPHDKRNERQYIMGNGFRHLRHNYLPALQAAPIGFSPASAAILAWSPFLAALPPAGDTRPPDLHIGTEGWSPDAAGTISLSLRIDDGPAGSLGGYLVYAQPPLDTVLAGSRLVGAYWQATLDFTLPSRPAEPVGLKVLAIDRSGNLAQQEITLPIEP